MGSEIHRVAQYNEQNYYITSMKQAAINVTYVYNFFEIIHNPIIILKCIFQSESEFWTLKVISMEIKIIWKTTTTRHWIIGVIINVIIICSDSSLFILKHETMLNVRRYENRKFPNTGFMNT